ncbi:bifunctional phosphopantothenoylcysteine decarboxylase/phosphopantothenate--cysteine ligase CoaBC [Woodsholea maritima]|uniref:bifunctional phosphopantothenoylcysteine decarboxylase/phosphopantothenate--cysteine ligase CoaBC n=1 Tax=Woodsholea maritima TaxID=240237 RepID=UPI00036D1327|nr:bifunctional phosphopantothenoylcysteine decarboxylase/phosphopantothenate--cysteine ligase CoaBC [Woodsholea maritima]
MAEARILLIISGGVAAFKSLELIRALKKKGITTTPILTEAAKQFVTPMSVSALSGQKVYDDLFSLTDEAEMGHIELSRSADLICVVPATANILAKAAHGLCDDLASTTLLATDTPVLMAPAMNVRMWTHAATQANVKTLRARGVEVIEPDEGEMACGEFGPGRLPEIERLSQIIEARLNAITAPKPLAGKRVVITAGPTIEPLDPVRFLSNHSSGKQGYALAEALRDAGADVILVSGPTQLPSPYGLKTERIETALEMLSAVENALPADIFIGVAAVADWRPKETSDKKLKLEKATVASLSLAENPDILRAVSQLKTDRPRLVIGFAAETHEVEKLAKDKRKRKGCDWIIANDVSGDVMGGSENEALIVAETFTRPLARASKAEIARDITAAISEHFAAAKA